MNCKLKTEEKALEEKLKFKPDQKEVWHFHPIAFVEQMRMMHPSGTGGNYCLNEMKVRAFLRLIKYKEGKPGEEGYRQIVGGTSFSDFSDHPRPKIPIPRLGVESSAAGAYQVLADTWDDSSMKKYREKYGIKDFSQLSQDLFALILLKYKRRKLDDKQVKDWGEKWADKMIEKYKSEKKDLTREHFPKYKTKYKDAYGDIIQMLIDKDLDRALLTAAPEWASFPESPWGQESSSYTLAHAKKKYREFLLEEIRGETDLHLEEGFLKKFGYDCCRDEGNIDEGDCTGTCGKNHIDLRPFTIWQTQACADLFGWKAKQSLACHYASVQILKYSGILSGGAKGSMITPQNAYGFNDYKNIIQTAVEQNDSIIILEDGTKRAIKYLDQELEKGNPVVVGVRYAYKKEELNYDKSTDHFIVVVGRGCENGKRFFRFYEVGTSFPEKGQHDENKLFVNEDWSVTGSTQMDTSKTYTLTHVRGNKTNGDFK